VKPHTTQYVTDRDSLRALCRRLLEHDRLAVDTEFVGESSFVPRLELIQVAAGDLCAVLDFPAIGSLDSFAEILAEPRIEKVFHAGRQDLELFFAHMGQVPTPVFDTQVAAAMVGYGTQVAYASLVERITGAKLDKSHTLSNWSQRPLTREQITYALEDVQFLLPIREHLQTRLLSLGRLDWAREEFARLGTRLSDGSQDPRLRYQRIKGWEGLKPRAAAVLRELAAWREEEACRRNVPRGRIVRDEGLVELARRTPTSQSALRAIRGLHPSEVERNGEAMLAAIKAGLAVPQSEWPEVPKTSRPEPEAAGLVDLLQAALKALASKEHIAPSLLASSADLQALVEAKHERETLDLPILQGWRRELAGEALLDILRGRTTLSVDPKTGKLRLTQQG
jgi:ribonuclease D